MKTQYERQFRDGSIAAAIVDCDYPMDEPLPWFIVEPRGGAEHPDAWTERDRWTDCEAARLKMSKREFDAKPMEIER